MLLLASHRSPRCFFGPTRKSINQPFQPTERILSGEFVDEPMNHYWLVHTEEKVHWLRHFPHQIMRIAEKWFERVLECQGRWSVRNKSAEMVQQMERIF